MEQIFISYARDDDERFVRRLYRDLLARDIFVWWDRKAMESRGRTFLDEIRDAIASAERVILVIGPKAATSDYVRQEWEFALQGCKAIVPILRLGRSAKVSNNDYGLIPAQLSRLHSPDFRKARPYREALDELVRILHEPLPRPGELYGVDALPPHYLPRPEPLARLNAMVRPDSSEPVIITSTRAATALEGMGGVGKSVLAAAFARACETRRRFDHGVIWLRFGRQAAVSKMLAFVAYALNDNPEKYSDQQTGSAMLSAALAKRNCLLILDDIWKLADTEPFLNALGIGCRALITTRDSGLSSAIGAQELCLDVLTADESLVLLSEWSGHGIAALPAEALTVADECGGLPLALAMIGAMVKSNRATGWTDVLRLLQNADLESIHQHFPNYPYPDLLRAMEVSVQALGSEETQRRYIELAVFPDNTPIPVTSIETLWQPLGITETDAHQLIDLFVDRSLIRRDPAGHLGLHDLQLDYVRKRCGDPSPLHRRLVEAYLTRCVGGWHTGPNDGYYLSRLIHHLIEAGRGQEVHHVLAEENAAGRNGWHEAKETAGDASGYRVDVARAWQLAESDSSMLPVRPLNGLECRYALINASLNSLGSSIPPSLLAALLRHGIWTADHAAAYALGIAEPKSRGKALAALAAHLPETLVRTALGSTGMADALAALCRHLAELGHPLEALAFMLEAPAQPYDELREFHQEAVQVVLRVAKAGYPEQALSAVRKLHPLYRADIWPELVPLLPKRLLPKALAVALLNPKEFGSDRALTALAPHLQKKDLPAALAAGLRIDDEMTRAWALGGLAPHLPEPLLRQALTDARQIQSVLARARALVVLAIRLPKSRRRVELNEALAAVRQIDHNPFRAIELAIIAPHLPRKLGDTVFRESLEATDGAEKSYDKRACLVQLVPQLPPTLLRSALMVARRISEPVERAMTLAELVAHLPQPLRQETLDTALEAARELSGIDDRALALIRIIPILPKIRRPGVLEEVLSYALRSDGVRDPAHILRLLIPELPEIMLRRLLDAVPRMHSSFDQSKVLTWLAAFLTEPLWPVALAAARSIEVADERAKILSVLASRLSGPLQSEAARDALTAASKVPLGGILDPDRRAKVMAEVATYLPGAAIPDALPLMRLILDDTMRTETLAALAPYLSEPLLQRAFDAVLGIVEPSAPQQADMLGGISLQFVELGLPDRSLHAIRHMWKGVYRDSTLSELVSRLAGKGYFQQALAAVGEIDSDLRRSDALIELAPTLPESLLPQALSVARAVEPDYVRYESLSKLFARTPQQSKDEAIQELLTLAKSIGRYSRHTLFTELAPYLSEDHLHNVITFLRDVGGTPGEPETALELAHYLREPERSQILLELLAAAKELPEENTMSGQHPRAETMIRMISVLSGLPRQDAMAAAFAASQQIVASAARARALVRMAEVLDEPRKSDALAGAVEAAAHIPYSEEKAKVLIELAPALPEALLLRALETAREVAEARDRVEALTALAVHLPEPSKAIWIAEAWTAAAAINAKAAVFRKSAAHLPEPRRTEALHEAIAEARSGIRRHKDLAELADYLPAPEKANILGEAVAATFKADFTSDRVTALQELAPYLAGLPTEDLLPIARGLLHRLARESRQDQLGYLQPLGSVIFALGGQQAVEETFRAILDVGRWWP